jgi:hypothetical protein
LSSRFRSPWPESASKNRLKVSFQTDSYSSNKRMFRLLKRLVEEWEVVVKEQQRRTVIFKLF